MIRPIHPFPARMAPEVAISRLSELAPSSIVLDPMAGSGTVLRHAAELGHRAIGYDMDPLAKLMSQVWTTHVEDSVILRLSSSVMKEIGDTKVRDVSLPWLDTDAETEEFVRYWFGAKQRRDLRKIAYVLHNRQSSRIAGKTRAGLNVLRIALSRIIITKDRGASLARDVSHSRPHRVSDESDFDVVSEFARSIETVRKLLIKHPPKGTVEVFLGDSRSLRETPNKSVDAVVTSPPYLNAIDYMRGHRLSLVWLGYRLKELRRIRSNSIGAERAPDSLVGDLFEEISAEMCDLDALASRHRSMVKRYVHDVYRMMSEIARVTKPGGKVTMVVGNSCLKGTFIRNSDGVARAGSMVGIRLVDIFERELPDRSRYLPLTSGPLDKRMRTETILTFVC